MWRVSPGGHPRRDRRPSTAAACQPCAPPGTRVAAPCAAVAAAGWGPRRGPKPFRPVWPWPWKPRCGLRQSWTSATAWLVRGQRQRRSCGGRSSRASGVHRPIPMARPAMSWAPWLPAAKSSGLSPSFPTKFFRIALNARCCLCVASVWWDNLLSIVLKPSWLPFSSSRNPLSAVVPPQVGAVGGMGGHPSGCPSIPSLAQVGLRLPQQLCLYLLCGYFIVNKSELATNTLKQQRCQRSFVGLGNHHPTFSQGLPHLCHGELNDAFIAVKLACGCCN